MTPSKGSGVERYSYDLATNLAERGVSLKIISKPIGGELYKYAYAFTKFPLTTIKIKAKVFHAVSPYSAKFLFSLHKRPILTSVHDVIYLDWQQESPRFFEKRRYKYNVLALNNSNQIIVPFEYTKEKIMEKFNIAEEKINVVRYGINLENFKNVDKPSSYSNFQRDVIFIGGVNPISRGGRIVLDIYSKLLNYNPNLRLAISGTGVQMDRLKKLATERNIFGFIKWIDFINEFELPQLLANSKVFFYPTFMGFSYLMMQSIAASVPVVTTNLFDNPEFIQNSELMRDPDDIDGFFLSILNILESYNLREQLVKKGLELLELYNPKKMVDETLKVYARISNTS